MHRFVLLFLFVGAVSAWSATSEADLFSEAESRYLGKNYSAALEAYDSFIARYPVSNLVADAQYRKAVCLYRLSRYSDSLAQLHEVELKFRSTRYYAYIPLWQGLVQYRLESWSLAVESLNAFLKGPVDRELTPEALLYKGLAQSQLGDKAGALESLALLVKDYRDSEVFPWSTGVYGPLLLAAGQYKELLAFTSGVDPSGFPKGLKDRFLLCRAEALWETGDSAAAVALYRGLTGAESDVALTAYRRLFSAAEKKGDLVEMQTLTRSAEERFSADPAVLADLWARVGVESYKAGNLDAASQLLTKVWDLRKTQDPGEAVPLYLAEISLARKDVASARAVLTEYAATPAGAKSAAVLMRLGDVALQAGDLEGAAGYYAKFLTAFPDSPRLSEAGYLLAYVKYRQNAVKDSLDLTARFLQSPGQYQRDIMRLRIVLLKKDGRTQEAASALSRYVTLYPDEPRARIDLLKALFAVKDFPAIVRESAALSAAAPALASADPYAYLLSAYLRGLASIALKDYPGAVSSLSLIQKGAAEKAGIGVIVPYAGYYLAWAYVKSGSFDKAAAALDGLLAQYPDHELSGKIQFLSGWSRFSLGQFDKAAAAFQKAADRERSTDLGQKSRYLWANSLFNAGKLSDASSAYQSILSAGAQGAYADRALFDYAGVLADQGAIAKAAETYRSLAQAYPSSPLAEESYYRGAETYFTGKMYALAKTAFNDYRSRYPNGKLYDAALYWGGETAMAVGEKFGAVLLWEELIKKFPKSQLRATAIRKSAEVYQDSRDLASALRLYTQLLTEYPDDARAAKADIIAEQLHYQLMGMGDREAELASTISRETGAAKNAAILELAKMYIYSGDKKVEQGVQMIQPLIKGSDASAASRALSLYGEYYYRKGYLMEASRQLLLAAGKAAGEPDFAASMIYRAAEMMKMAQRPADVQALYKRLSDNYPSSPWTTRAKALLEAGK